MAAETMTDRKNAAISRGVGMTTQIYADRAENAGDEGDAAAQHGERSRQGEAHDADEPQASANVGGAGAAHHLPMMAVHGEGRGHEGGDRQTRCPRDGLVAHVMSLARS